MNDHDTGASGSESRVVVLDDEGAAEHERPVSGDLSAQTRRLLLGTKRREGRFPRRPPAEPMS